ncbi:hypothetical protein R1sor_021289 [Riccia sorocarpa]|uniref:Uncharacterized protein n=1 Tax=Riccia sorocarpa TaxID=122646 RepID=A0ABD3GGP9_9MARC
MDLEYAAYVVAGGSATLNRAVSPASSLSSSNSEMKQRAMARSVGTQKNTVRHRMTKQEYEMIVSYLEIPDNFAAITGDGRKTIIAGKAWTKMTTFGHMAVTLSAQGFLRIMELLWERNTNVRKPRTMARSVEAQKNAAWHRMTKQEYEMIVSYLEIPDNFATITRDGRKTKIVGKTWTKVMAFGHMAVRSRFPPYNEIVMGKK